MSEPENLVLRQLRELRADMDRRFEATDAEIRALQKRLDSQIQAITGESVLGRYAAVEVEEQLSAIRDRLHALENR